MKSSQASSTLDPLIIAFCSFTSNLSAIFPFGKLHHYELSSTTTLLTRLLFYFCFYIYLSCPDTSHACASSPFSSYARYAYRFLPFLSRKYHPHTSTSTCPSCTSASLEDPVSTLPVAWPVFGPLSFFFFLAHLMRSASLLEVPVSSPPVAQQARRPQRSVLVRRPNLVFCAPRTYVFICGFIDSVSSPSASRRCLEPSWPAPTGRGPFLARPLRVSSFKAESLIFVFAQRAQDHVQYVFPRQSRTLCLLRLPHGVLGQCGPP